MTAVPDANRLPRPPLRRRPPRKLKPGQGFPVFYRDLENEVRTRRLAELRAQSSDNREGGVPERPDAEWGPACGPTHGGHPGGKPTPAEAKALSNTMAALKAFCRANLITRDATIGPELIRKLDFNRACLAMTTIDIAPKTAERHRNEMSARIRPWALTLRRRQYQSATSFPILLGAMMADADVSFDKLSEDAQVPAMTLRSWTTGEKTPAVRASLASVRRIETALGAEPGTLERLCKIRIVEMSPSRLKIPIDEKEFRRIRRFLPADFEDRSSREQHEIHDWVWDNLILSPADETIGRGSRAPYLLRLIGPDGARGVGDAVIAARAEKGLMAGPQLQAQVDALVAFKTDDFPPIGKQRSKIWSEVSSVRAQLHRLEMFFGALASEGAAAEAFGLDDVLSCENIQTFIAFMRKRRGAYTTSILTTLCVVASLLNEDEGFVSQNRGLFRNHPASGSQASWADACATSLAFIWERYGQVDAQISVGRDPFFPIMPVLEAERPRAAYAKIADEIRANMPAASVNVTGRARHFRLLIPFLYAIRVPLRAKNFAGLRLVPPGGTKTPMAALSRLRHPELWRDPATGIWWHRQPKSSFKNRNSPATDDIEIPLKDTDRFYAELEEYLALRPILLAGSPDPGTLFLKDKTHRLTKDPAMNAATFGDLWRTILQQFGIYNPYTGTGAIPGLRMHGPHAVRHILATDAVKLTGGFAEASAILFATETMVAKHYARFLPKDRFLRAMAIMDGERPVGPRLTDPRAGKRRGNPGQKL